MALRLRTGYFLRIVRYVREIYYKRSIKLLENGKNEKRYILAKMDFAFLQCVYFEKFDEIRSHP